MFKITNLTAYIENKKILDEFSLTINDGEIHALMGKNGIGKSTLCKIIMRDPSYEVKNGSIVYQNTEILNKPTFEVAKLGIMYINQNPPSIEGVTNMELLRTALREKTGENINIFKFNKAMEEASKKLDL